MLPEVLQKELGCSLEEAKAIIAEKRAAAGGAPAAPGDAGNAEKQRLAALEAENQLLKSTQEEDKRRNRKAVNRQKDERLAMELRLIAVQSGIAGDRPLSYAVNEYRAAVLGTPDGTEPPQPGPFFSELLKTLPNLGGAAGAPPVEVHTPPSTVPPGAAAGAPPPAPGPGTRTPPKNVEEMTDAEFSAHTRATHGYSPGTY